MTSTHRDTTPTRRYYARLVRTTLKIDDDVIEAAWCIAADEGVTVGDVMSRLARRGLESRPETRARGRFPTFAVSRDAPPITLDMVKRALED
jgi:hypothetical protein